MNERIDERPHPRNPEKKRVKSPVKNDVTLNAEKNNFTTTNTADNMMPMNEKNNNGNAGIIFCFFCFFLMETNKNDSALHEKI